MRRRHAKEFFCVALPEKSQMGATLVITVAHTSLERAIGSWVAVYVSLAESTTDNLTG